MDGTHDMIKVIETEYNGLLFRSRLEARWAYGFDQLGIPYEYEKEGYELKCGRYLPDFWLPQHQVWVENKGSFPTKAEQQSARSLADHTEYSVLVLYHGIPKSDGYVDDDVFRIWWRRLWL